MGASLLGAQVPIPHRASPIAGDGKIYVQGENGFLVLLQENSPHVPIEGSAVLQSTLPEFGGLPGDIYTDSHSLSNRIDFIVGSSNA